jgi:hypothetical protein
VSFSSLGRRRASAPAGRSPARRSAASSDTRHDHRVVLALQRSVGNQAVAALLGSLSSPPIRIQRDVDSAAQDLYQGGIKKVTSKLLNGPFRRKHSVTQQQLEDIQTRLDEIRQEHDDGGQQQEIPSVADPRNRPTQGGMVEEDARVIADLNGWELSNQTFTCTDKSHTPKGNVYYSRDNGAYYGADNTGHVGWGFKVWTKIDKTTLKYNGNLVWDGDEWKHISRGT